MKKPQAPQKGRTNGRALRTPAEVRADFIRRGESFAEWARQHQVNPHLVSHVLRGRACLRGDSHKIAVLLGLKDGEVVL